MSKFHSIHVVFPTYSRFIRYREGEGTMVIETCNLATGRMTRLIVKFDQAWIDEQVRRSEEQTSQMHLF